MKRVGHKRRNSGCIHKKFGHNISGNKEKWVQIVITCYLYPTADDTLSIYVCNYVAIDILTSDALYSEDLLCMIQIKGVLCPTPLFSTRIPSKLAALCQLQNEDRRRQPAVPYLWRLRSPWVAWPAALIFPLSFSSSAVSTRTVISCSISRRPNAVSSLCSFRHRPASALRLKVSASMSVCAPLEYRSTSPGLGVVFTSSMRAFHAHSPIHSAVPVNFSFLSVHYQWRRGTAVSRRSLSPYHRQYAVEDHAQHS